ncbi:Cytochrome P450 [Dillenia turbinata]|uniref:Cytochrome P450 n=1 Tax=Dillenia turbinata TaxID=194707 RepID=A0AAN8Z2I7_9MAGN
MDVMAAVETLIVFLLSALFLGFLLAVINFLHKTWLAPLRLQSFMRSQGIRGPAYRFFYGNTKEICSMRKDSMSKPMDLSHNILPRLLPHVHSWTKLYGMNTLVWDGHQAQLITMDLEIIRDVLNDKDGAYQKHKTQGFSKKLFGDGLVASEGEKWAKLRKIANHTFHAESLKNMVPGMISSAEAMLERWRDFEGKEIEVFEEFRVLTSEVISRTAFGSSYLEGKKIFEMLAKLTQIMVRNFYTIRFPAISKIFKTSDDIEAEKLEKGIWDLVMEMVRNREKKVTGGEMENYGSDFLGLLLKANHDIDEKKGISIEDLVDECKTFYIAGQETTTTLLSWTVLLLAIHDDWQEKARKEVLELFGQENPNSDGIARLKMMNMIINESLRLYPPVISLPRKTRREARVGKLIFPADLNFSIPVLALHHDPKIWGADALVFKPERFSEGVAKATNNNIFAFLPFGLGPRNCVGSSFAVMEAKVALSMILQRYSITQSPAYIHSPFPSLTAIPQHGVQVVLKAL